MAGSDYTAQVRDQLLDEHHDGQVPGDDREQQISEAQARYPAARVYWDDEVDDVVVDISSGRR